MHLFLIILFLFLSKIIVAQSNEALPKAVGTAQQQVTDTTIELIVDERISKLLELKKNNALHSPQLPGYRVQLFYGPRTEALKYQADFLKVFPDVSCYLIYEAPYFKVRVGDYRDKYEARRAHLSIVDGFPDSFLLEDKINLPKLPE